MFRLVQLFFFFHQAKGETISQQGRVVTNVKQVFLSRRLGKAVSLRREIVEPGLQERVALCGMAISYSGQIDSVAGTLAGMIIPG